MRKIQYLKDGALETLNVNWRARFAHVPDDAGAIAPLEEIDRSADEDDPVINWAEPEEDFLERVAAKDVPAGATNVVFID